MLDNLKISGKLFIGFGVILAVLAFVNLFNISNAEKINQQVDHVREVRYRDAIDRWSAFKVAGAG